jgi:CubicO group peptidase (beta-lactamase class C family)
MGEVLTAGDPREVGMDAGRLGRIDSLLQRYVDEGKLAGWQVLVTRRGQVAHLAKSGIADLEAGRPVADDTIWRIYSMTKPITSVAAMSLYEEAAFALTDPISRWLPEFADVRVFTGGSASQPVTVPATEPIRMWHLLSHTAGFTYGFHHTHTLDEMYRDAGFEFHVPKGMDLGTSMKALAELPVAFEPGSSWEYGMSTDVLGAVIEVISGQTLEELFVSRVLAPLGMTETTFWVEPERQDRLAALYALGPGLPAKIRYDVLGADALHPPGWFSGGGGLMSTLSDYHRFTQCLLRGGELDGVRVLGPRTLAMMTQNHLPGGRQLQEFGGPVSGESRLDGMGFGLGFAVMEDPITFKTFANVGEFSWGGAASTCFWVDPVEQITAVLMTQLMPPSNYPLRTQLRQLVGQAIVA